MRIKPEQLDQHLQKGLQPLYLLFGDEPLLIQEAADTIRRSARLEGCGEREVFTAERGFNWQNLLASGNSLSLFSSRRLVEVRIPSGKPGNDGSQALQEYCSRLPPDTVTLVICPKLDKAAQAGKWFKAMEQAGVAVAFFPVERAQLPAWIGARLGRQNQRAEPVVLQFLADQVEGNLLAAFQEVQKLALLFPAGVLSLEQVRDAVADVARFDVFKLGDALLAGDAARVYRILDVLRGEGEDPVLILWALTREIRTLAKLRGGMRRGGSLPQLMRDAWIWETRQRLVEQAVKRTSEARLLQGLRQAAGIDRMIKGLAKGDVWDELLQLGLTMTKV
ncbi:MAG: DNA polymerase III subunit delta [Sulfurimicrobium sp.]|jgi:DNA polymerase-3 subunit delta|nr:DNA polymerase III subunit delta [Sulfurimicrobium sp.]MDZ7657437.1 DNA polymerase III subunit delta [Sulfurimicrobium sp.]